MPTITGTCECGCGAPTGVGYAGTPLRFVTGHAARRNPIGATCGFDGCGRAIEARALCHSHYAQERRGRTLTPILDTDMARFMAKVTKLPSGHWMWTGAVSSEGRYGAATFEKRVRPAHVVAWLLFRGTYPEGWDIDHLCRKTLCVNPEHLQPKTHRNNVLVGDSPQAINAAKTHCIRNHEFTPENTYVPKAGGRQCIACRTSKEGRLKQRDATRRYRARQKLASRLAGAA